MWFLPLGLVLVAIAAYYRASLAYLPLLLKVGWRQLTASPPPPSSLVGIHSNDSGRGVATLQLTIEGKPAHLHTHMHWLPGSYTVRGWALDSSRSDSPLLPISNIRRKGKTLVIGLPIRPADIGADSIEISVEPFPSDGSAPRTKTFTGAEPIVLAEILQQEEALLEAYD